MRLIAWASVWMGLIAVAGCQSTPTIQTRSYVMRDPVVEEQLMKTIAGDEFSRLGVEKTKRVLDRYGQPFETVQLKDDTAIVRTTSHGHREITNALREFHSAASIKANAQATASKS